MINIILNITKSKNLFFLFMAIASAMLYGSVGYYGTKIIHSGISTFNMLFWRFFISFLALGSLLYITFPKALSWSRLFSKKLIFLSIYYSISTAFCFFASLELGIGMAMTIFFVFPVFSVFLSWYKNKNTISNKVIFSIILCLASIILIIPDDNSRKISHLGIVYSLLAALTFSIYLFFTKQYAPSTPIESTLSLMVGNSIIFFIASILTGNFAYPDNPAIWSDTFTLAIMSTVIPTILMIYAMKKISSTKVAVTSVFEPLFALIIGNIILGEYLSMQQLLGIVIIISASILIQIDKSPQNA